jgi:hypothetical protein
MLAKQAFNRQRHIDGAPFPRLFDGSVNILAKITLIGRSASNDFYSKNWRAPIFPEDCASVSSNGMTLEFIQ